MSGTRSIDSDPTAAVMVVDTNAEQRLMLCELLGQLGLNAIAIRSASEACGRLGSAPASVVVADGDALGPDELSTLLDAAARTNSPIVVAGTNRPWSTKDPRCSFVRKPYHYRELVHKIWSALGVVGTQIRAAA